MILDKTLAKEIKKTANGDGSREARFAFLKIAKEAAKELSTINAAEVYGQVLKKYGRAVTALCTAATIAEKKDRLDRHTVEWARDVLKLWTNRPSDTAFIAFNDGLHPTRIEEYAGSFIRLTTEDEDGQ